MTPTKGQGMRSKLAALAIGGTALLGAGLPMAASAATSAPHRAGVCTVSGSYTESDSGGSFTVVATHDSCVGGGTIKWQAEEQCAVTTGGDLFTYSLWKNGADSAVAGDSDCTINNGGEMLDGYIRINENNPERTTLWSGGASSGTFSVHS